jgi:hypothetical protein
MPDQYGQFACRCDGGDVLPTLGLRAQKGAAQRARCGRCGPTGLDQHAASVSTRLLGNPPVVRRSWSGLPDARVQTEIADQLLGTGKTLDIANRSHYASATTISMREWSSGA